LRIIDHNFHPFSQIILNVIAVHRQRPTTGRAQWNLAWRNIVKISKIFGQLVKTAQAITFDTYSTSHGKATFEESGSGQEGKFDDGWFRAESTIITLGIPDGKGDWVRVQQIRYLGFDLQFDQCEDRPPNPYTFVHSAGLCEVLFHYFTGLYHNLHIFWTLGMGLYPYLHEYALFHLYCETFTETCRDTEWVYSQTVFQQFGTQLGSRLFSGYFSI
jgi:hypothetical protein